MPAVPLTQALRDCARADPDRPAITDGEISFTRRQVDELTDLAAARLRSSGGRPGSVIAMSGGNSAQLLMLAFAIWKLGAVPLPLHARKDPDELVDLVARAGAVVAIGFAPSVEARLDASVRDLAELFVPGEVEPLPDVPVSPRLRIGASGGSTGPSKLISVDVPAIVNPDRPWHYGLRRDGTHVVSLDIVDGTGFVASTAALALGCHQVLMREFDAETLLALIAAHQADWIAMTQPGLVATAKLPRPVRESYDLGSLRCVTQYSGAVADWVKRAWIDWLGPERIAESYGATDARGSTWIDGTQWLARPGSVGTAQRGCEIGVFDADGRRLEPGQLGLVYLRDLTGRRNFHYLGDEPEALDGGWETFGDLGRLDSDGYLYLADRAKDMIRAVDGLLAPLPIEGAIEYHPHVRSAVVIGLPGSDGFDAVHAIVDTPGRPVTDGELATMLATQFADVRRPDSWERADGPLRDNAGKAARLKLRAERLPVAPAER